MAIPFTVIELDKPRKIRFGMGAMCEYEQLTGKKILELSDEMSMTTCAQLLWCALKNEDENLTLKDTLNLIDDNCDDINYVIGKLTEAIAAAFPKAKNVTAPAAKAK